MDYKQLRDEFKSFEYDSYEYNIENEKLKLVFTYRLVGSKETITFKHRVEYFTKGDIPFDLSLVSNLKNFVFHIGMVETINYWKLACPKDLNVNCGYLNESQVKWWKKLYYHGLGEFIYLNNMVSLVNEDNFLEINSLKITDTNNQFLGSNTENLLKSLKTSGNLIPVGGGKDSVVTLEVLKASLEDNTPFVMSPPIAAYDCIEVAGYSNYLEARRIFDKQIMEMNAKGYLNGHVPFSAILAFISTLGAALVGKRYIPLSNEKSANEPSVIGTTFNHQYSKSFEFEMDFDEYLHNNLTEDISYFSLLRSLYEIQIGEMFSTYEHYHSVYRSCNRGKKTNEWCGVCAKCLFVYIILSPYVERQALIGQFGKDLLDDIELKPIFDELIGTKDTKPFECVGTIWEVRHALNLTLQQFDDGALLEYYRSINGPALPAEPTEYEDGELVPMSHRELLKKEMDLVEELRKN